MQKRCDLLVLKVDAVAVVLLKVDPAVSVMVDIHNTIVNNCFSYWANERLKEQWLPRLATDTLGAVALSESSSGSDAFALKTTARRDGARDLARTLDAVQLHLEERLARRGAVRRVPSRGGLALVAAATTLLDDGGAAGRLDDLAAQLCLEPQAVEAAVRARLAPAPPSECIGTIMSSPIRAEPPAAPPDGHANS